MTGVQTCALPISGSGHYYLDLLEGLLGLEECQQLEWDQVLEWVREFLRQEME